MTPIDIDPREGHVSDVDALHEFKRVGMRTKRLHAPPTDDDYKELYQAYSDSSGNNNRVNNQIIFFILIKIVDPHLFHL